MRALESRERPAHLPAQDVGIAVPAEGFADAKPPPLSAGNVRLTSSARGKRRAGSAHEILDGLCGECLDQRAVAGAVATCISLVEKLKGHGHPPKGGCPSGEREEVVIVGHDDLTQAPRAKLALRLVEIRKAFGHDGRGRGDDQGNGEHDLLHR